MLKKVCLIISIITVILVTILLLFKEKTYKNESIVIGSSIPLSGPLSPWGKAVLNTTNSYFFYTNDNNIIPNKKIIFKAFDDKYEPDLTTENIKKLSEKNIFALYGIVGTPTNKRVLSIPKDYNIAFFSPFSGASFLRDKSLNNIINLRPSYQEEIAHLINYIVEVKKLSKIAIFYQNDEYGEEGYIWTLKSLKEKNIELISTGTYKRNTLSINHAFNEIKKSKPEAIIIAGAYKATSFFIKKAKKDPIFKNTLFCNISFSDANSIVKELEASKTDTNNIIFSQVVPNFNDTNLEIVKEYHSIMHKYAPEEELGFLSFESFLASKVLVNAIQQNSNNLTTSNFIKTLKNTPKDLLKEVKIDYKNNQLLHKTYLYFYKNNKFEEIK